MKNKKKKKTFIVVAGDGGGMKGINILTLLAEIAKKSGSSTQEFGYLHVGTSTSTIAAAGLLVPEAPGSKKPKYNELDIRSFYFNDGPLIFPKKRNKLSLFQKKRAKKNGSNNQNGILHFFFNGHFYKNKDLKAVLDERFGDMLVKDCLDPFVFPTMQFNNGEAIWFTNVPALSERIDNVYYVPDMPVADIVHACSAPNFIFDYHSKIIKYKEKNHETNQWEDKEVEMIPTDGAYFAASPERDAYNFAQAMLASQGYKDDEYRIVLLSLGTGKKHINYSLDDLKGKSGILSSHFKSLAQIKAAETAIEILLTSQFRSRRPALKEEINRNGDLYFRFDATIDNNNPDHPDAGLTNASMDNMRKLVRFARNVVIPENQEEFDTFVKLVKRYSKGQDIEAIAEKRLADYYKPLTKIDASKKHRDDVKKKKNIWDSWFGGGKKEKQTPANSDQPTRKKKNGNDPKP